MAREIGTQHLKPSFPLLIALVCRNITTWKVRPPLFNLSNNCIHWILAITEHEIAKLDEEFRRVSRRIDKDYKEFRCAALPSSPGYLVLIICSIIRRAGSVASSTSRHSHKSSKSSRRDRSHSRSVSPSRRSRRRSSSPSVDRTARNPKDLTINPPHPHAELKHKGKMILALMSWGDF